MRQSQVHGVQIRSPNDVAVRTTCCTSSRVGPCPQHAHITVSSVYPWVTRAHITHTWSDGMSGVRESTICRGPFPLPPPPPGTYTISNPRHRTPPRARPRTLHRPLGLLPRLHRSRAGGGSMSIVGRSGGFRDRPWRRRSRGRCVVGGSLRCP